MSRHTDGPGRSPVQPTSVETDVPSRPVLRLLGRRPSQAALWDPGMQQVILSAWFRPCDVANRTFTVPPRSTAASEASRTYGNRQQDRETKYLKESLRLTQASLHQARDMWRKAESDRKKDADKISELQTALRQLEVISRSQLRAMSAAMAGMQRQHAADMLVALRNAREAVRAEGVASCLGGGSRG